MLNRNVIIITSTKGIYQCLPTLQLHTSRTCKLAKWLLDSHSKNTYTDTFNAPGLPTMITLISKVVLLMEKHNRRLYRYRTTIKFFYPFAVNFYKCLEHKPLHQKTKFLSHIYINLQCWALAKVCPLHNTHNKTSYLLNHPKNNIPSWLLGIVYILEDARANDSPFIFMQEYVGLNCTNLWLFAHLQLDYVKWLQKMVHPFLYQYNFMVHPNSLHFGPIYVYPMLFYTLHGNHQVQYTYIMTFNLHSAGAIFHCLIFFFNLNNFFLCANIVLIFNSYFFLKFQPQYLF